jgi:hypothetical protein
MKESRSRESSQPEKIAQRDSLLIVPGKPVIELADPQFERTDQPTVVLVERFERRAALEIERTDVATFLDLTGFVLENDSKWQPLRAADIRPIFIDTTLTLLVEKCASADGMGHLVPQEIRMRASNLLGLDLRYCQIVQATGRTAPSTLQTFGVDLRERVRRKIDLCVKIAKIFETALRIRSRLV